MQQAKRILLIGLGRWGVNHLRVLQSMPVELFVAESDPARLNSSGVPQSHRTADAASLFPIIDAAVVVTPAHTHFEICRDLLVAGKDVFVEKPITSESADAKELIELANSSGLVLQVGHIFRFDPASVWMKDAIAQGRFGEIKMLRANFTCSSVRLPDALSASSFARISELLSGVRSSCDMLARNSDLN